jgi:programmed cell death 6-interacting protein
MASNPNQFLTIPAKKPFDVNLSTPIKNFIKATFGDKEDYSASVDGFNSLRAEALLRSNYKDDCSKLLRYYDQLHAIEYKLPITENQIRIYFKWQDAFVSGGSLFGSKQKTNGSWKLAYEKACVLFNIGHAYSELAVVQNLSIDEQMKAASRYFQLASGIFSYLKDYVNANSLTDLSVDFEPAVLASISWLMLAQAAELIYMKSASFKDEVAAKVAAHAADCYKEAYTSAKTESAKKIIPENYVNIVFVKHLLFQSKTEYHAGNQAQTDRKYGLKVVRYDRAKDFADQAVSKCTIAAFTPTLRANQEEIIKAAAAAHKDNDFVYHERLPDPKTLETIVAQPIAKPLPVVFPLTHDFRDLFASLVPIALNNALAAFSAKRAEIMNIEINRIREATNVLNSFLASVNLPAAIEDSGGRQIPASVTEKSNEIKRQGGINTLDKMINDLPESLTRNKEILDETNRMLDDEERGDIELRNQFKERWTRTTSASLTVPLREEAKKYMDIIQNAINADKVVQEKYRMNRDCIVLLSKQTHEIADELPSATAGGALRDSFVVRELHRLMDSVAAIKAEREVIESELKNTDSDSVRARLIAAFQQGSHNDENSVVVHEIESIYTPLRQQVNESVSKQEQLVENIRRANQQFQSEKQGNASSGMRDEMLKNLARAYDAFQELLSNLREGNKFYNDLTPLLLKFQTKVSDFVFARKTEKEDLMKDIQRGIVGGNTAPATTQQSSNNPYAASATPPYPQAHQPSAPPTGGPPPTTAPDGSSLPYPGAYMQPFFPMPPGYNPYNPFFNTMAPPYPMAGAPQYPQQGYGVEKPHSGGKKK